MDQKKNWVDFKQIKEAVSIEMVLDRYSVQLRRVNKTQLRGKCPLPTHTSEKGESFNVNVSKNAWNCKSESCVAARGRAGGNQLDLVAAMESCSIRDAALKLQEWFNVEASSEPREKQAAAKKTREPAAGKESVKESDNEGEENKPLAFALKSVDPSHPYLAKRGIKKETAETFGVGYFSGKGSMSGRVVIPIHDDRGVLVAYAGRAIDDTEPKYKLPPGFKKSRALFNLNRALKSDGSAVVVVEGFFDAMKVRQAEIPCVVALMGDSLSDAQEKLFIENFDRVVLMLDGDDAGQETAGVIAGKLIRKMFVRVVTLSQGQQPDRLSSDEIRKILEFLL